ncbi:MAG TPA: tRNA (adenosine(37)-N6)-threonylcarbamoyltransferase complex ATPase subunit type 1 TsaE [Roseiflexaceae bacterium]|nr:tRNA (adenosine(37)-N6)-threonylcarbamoyltransferase complex ATPase subunit type 1 TsaE [Roseiflexaceae bacterium]
MIDRRAHTVQSPHVLDFISHSAAQTIRVGQRLGELLQPGDVLLLLGDFGAGKTHFAKGVAQGLGSEDMVNSPSFVLINEYRAGPRHGHMPIYHIDLYRIESPGELAGIGLEDAIGGEGIALIEWAERAQGWLPHDHLAVHLQHLSDTKRVLRFVPTGRRYEELVAAFKRTAFA